MDLVEESKLLGLPEDQTQDVWNDVLDQVDMEQLFEDLCPPVSTKRLKYTATQDLALRFLYEKKEVVREILLKYQYRSKLNAESKAPLRFYKEGDLLFVNQPLKKSQSNRKHTMYVPCFEGLLLDAEKLNISVEMTQFADMTECTNALAEIHEVFTRWKLVRTAVTPLPSSSSGVQFPRPRKA